MIAKVVFLCAALAAVSASGLIHAGSSVSSRKQDDFGNYAFNYDIVDHKGATNGRYEVGDGYGNKKGAYTITDIDGRARRVEYVADSHGFRAAVKTNEPGTAASAPAAAVISSPYAGPVAPVAIAHSVPAPVYAAGPAHGGYGYAGYAPGAYGHGAHGHGAGAYGHGGYGHGGYGHGGYGHGVVGVKAAPLAYGGAVAYGGAIAHGAVVGHGAGHYGYGPAGYAKGYHY